MTSTSRQVPDVALLVSVAVPCIALSFAGFYWDGWNAMPVGLRFVAGVIAFGISPGLLVAGPFVAGRSREIGFADFIHAVFTCSFSCNLLFNITLFLVEPSFADLAWAYLVVQGIGYALWGAYWWHQRRNPSGAGSGRVTVILSTSTLTVGLGLAAAAAAVIYIAYVNGSPPVNPEELVSLRKLAENPSVRYDNITFRNGDPATYLFVPFQILIVGTSVLSHLDVVLTYSIFWAVTTALSTIVITRLAYVLFGRAQVAAIVCLLIVGIALFDPFSIIDGAGIGTPYPNRYGFGSGVLLPLGLLWLWSILRESATHLWRWALLIYLVVETTFVHARETILSMGTMIVLFILLAARLQKHRAEIVRLASALALMVVVLIAYKYVNLGVSPELADYVSRLSAASRSAMTRLVDARGLWPSLVTEAPDSLTMSTGTAGAANVTVAGYRSLFVESWRGDPSEIEYLGRLFLPVVLLVLPVYALLARSLSQLSLALVLAGLAIVTASGPIELYLSAIVGNPEIFVADAVIFIAAIYIFADAVCAAGTATAERCSRSRTLKAALAVAVAGVVVVAFALATQIAGWREALASYWTTGLAWALIGATIVAASYRVARYGLPLFADIGQRRAPALGAVVACGLTLAVLMPAVRESEIWRRNPFQPEYPPGRFSGDFVDDYAMLDASDRLEPTVYPVEIVRYLRTGLPPNQTFLSADTLALMLTAPHYAPIVSTKGEVPPSYISNSDYLNRFARDDEGTFAVLPYVGDEEGRRLLNEMLERFRVDYLIVDPAESPMVGEAIAGREGLRSLLQRVFDAEGFVVYRVSR